MQPDSRLCPPHIRESIDAYVKDGRQTGSFLEAVLANDLKEAIGRADEDNLDALPHIVCYLYNEVPSIAWGSPKKVSAHFDRMEARR